MPSSTRMTFTLVGRDHLSQAFRRAGLNARRLKMDLASIGGPAALPTAAAGAVAALNLAAAVGAAGLAVGVFGAAIGPQVAKMGEISEAHKKYAEAVSESGRTSAKAAEASLEVARASRGVPAATRESAAAYAALKDSYKAWSAASATDTMPVLTKSFQLLNGLLPKTSPLVAGTSRELDRLMTIAAGGVASDSFGKLNQDLTDFSVGAVQGAVNGVVHLSRTMGSFDAGPWGEFMDQGADMGPEVAAALVSVANAAGHLAVAGMGLGSVMLTLVSAFAKVVSAIPPEIISTVMQLYVAFRLLSTVGAGIGAVAMLAGTLGTRLVAMRTAAVASTGAIAGLRAAFLALSTAARTNLIVAGVAALVVVLTKLGAAGRQAPPDVDRLTTSLGRLSTTGKASGEAAKQWGKDLEGLYDSVRAFTDPSTADKIQQGLVKTLSLGFLDSTPTKEAKADFEAIDKALSALVKNGNARQAADALAVLKRQYAEGGHDVSDFAGKLKGYKSALADARFEQEVAAEGMGLFGQQAVATKAKLDEQKASADGLRQAIQALNDVHRQGLGGMIGFEAALDAASKAAKENAGALTMSGGQLNLGSEKARNAATALQDLASKTDEAASAARESGASWSSVQGIYERGRASLVKTAQQMGLTRKQANSLADQILKIPDKKVILQGNSEDLSAKIKSAQKRVDSLKQKRKTAVGADKRDLDDKVSAAQRKLNGLKQKQAAVIAARDGTGPGVADAKRSIDSVSGKTVTIGISYYIKNPETLRKAHGGGGYASGGLIRGYASGGEVQMFPRGGLISGPGGPTSDSILGMFPSGATARVSDSEYVVRASAVRRYGVGLLNAINEGRLNLATLAGAGIDVARGLAGGMAAGTGSVESGARAMASAVIKGVARELEIASPSKAMRRLGAYTGQGLIKGLSASRDKITATAKELASRVRDAFKGKREDHYLDMISRNNKRLQGLARERDKIAARIDAAKEYASGVADSARSTMGIDSLYEGGGKITAAGIKSGLQTRLRQLQRFSSNISKLTKMGLNKNLLREILEMGPIEGAAYAEALAGTTANGIRNINKAQKAIDSTASALGRKGADYLYDDGKNAAKGFLAGLASQQKAIEKQMLKIARAMQKAIRRALGINSPSTVMRADGRHTGAGFALGVEDTLPQIDRAAAKVRDAVAQPAAMGGPQVRPFVPSPRSGGYVDNSTTTTNVYPQRADFSTQQLEAMERRLSLQRRDRRPR